MKESVAEIETIIADIDRKIAEAEFKIMQPPFDFIKASRKPSSICYGDNSEDFFYTETGNAYWRLELSKSIKPFCPMSSYEILAVTDGVVVCRWVKDNKKKGTVTYQLELKHKNRRLCAESFDINKANT